MTAFFFFLVFAASLVIQSKQNVDSAEPQLENVQWYW